METIKRRTFIKSAAGAAAASVVPAANAEEFKTEIIVVHGTDIAKMVAAGIEKLGGWGKFFKPDAKVAIKVNAAWKSTPEQGGNTHPEIVKTFIEAAEAAKVKSINLPENTCHPERESFPASGIQAVVEKTSAKLYRPKKGDYKTVNIPGQVCKSAEVPKDILEADVLINIPVAKHHGGAGITVSMKNWMGSVSNESRRGWHRDGLPQCIADFSLFLKPTLICVDATRVMLDHGPQGPGTLSHPNEIIFGTDPVACDAYAATLFGKKPLDIKYIEIAEKAGVGCADLSKVKITRVEV